MIAKWMNAVQLRVVVFATFSVAISAHGWQVTGQQRNVDARVVAYEQTAVGLLRMTFVENTEVLFVRVERCKDCSDEPEYLRLQYLFWHNEPTLPDAMFSVNQVWNFKLTRQTECDGPIPETEVGADNSKNGGAVSLPRLDIMPWSHFEELPKGKSLHCYELLPGDFKVNDVPK